MVNVKKKEKKRKTIPEILFLGKFDPNLQGNFIEIALLHRCSPVNLVHNCRTLEHLKWFVFLNMETYLGTPQYLIPGTPVTSKTESLCQWPSVVN